MQSEWAALSSVFSSPKIAKRSIGRDFLPQCTGICHDKCLDDCRHMQEGPEYLMTVASRDRKYSSSSHGVGTTEADWVGLVDCLSGFCFAYFYHNALPSFANLQ